MTNNDILNGMTIKEKAKMLGESNVCVCCVGCQKCNHNCEYGITLWLESEANEND